LVDTTGSVESYIFYVAEKLLFRRIYLPRRNLIFLCCCVWFSWW